MARVITGVNDGSDLFPDGTNSVITSNTTTTTVTGKNSAGNVPIDASNIDANHILYSVDGTDYKSVNLSSLGLGGSDPTF